MVPCLPAPTLAEQGRIVKQVRFSDRTATVVVAEGDLEPRSIGSYAVRIYAFINPDFPFDKLVTGIIRPRDGVVEEVKFADLDGHGSPEIVVVIRISWKWRLSFG